MFEQSKVMEHALVPTFDVDEFFELASHLENHHLIFSRLWLLGKPILTDEIDVAAVTFDSSGEQLQFLLNPAAWSLMTLEQKLFLIAHECMHCILHHGVRAINVPKGSEHAANVAMDVTINHFLVRNLAFDRALGDPGNNGCWVDTVFSDAKNIPDDEMFEFYFNLLSCNAKQSSASAIVGNGGDNGGDNEPATLDDHRFLTTLNDPMLDEQLRQSIEKNDAEDLKGFVSKQEKDIEDECKQRGLTPGNLCHIASIAKVRAKRKWETVIKKWAKSVERDKEIEQWTRSDRRLVTMSPDFFIPTWVEDETLKKDRIVVWFFQDTSGSCSHLADRFFKAAKTLPTDRFDVRMFCFDTQVYETSLKTGKLYGFGGTTFTCIERYIQTEIKRTNAKYPRSVWVVTDGYGDKVFPGMPERWNWFLCTNYTDCIPRESEIHQLKDFE